MRAWLELEGIERHQVKRSPDDGAEQRREDDVELERDVDQPMRDGHGDALAHEGADEVHRGGHEDGDAQGQGARVDRGRDGVRGVMEAVDELECHCRRQHGKEQRTKHFHEHAANNVRNGLAGVDRVLHRVEERLPLDRVDGIAVVVEDVREPLTGDRVALVLDGSHAVHLLAHDGAPLEVLEVLEEDLELGGCAPCELGHLDGLGTDRIDVVEVEARGDVLHAVDDVVELAHEQVDVLAVKGADEGVLQQRERLARDGIAVDLVVLQLGDPDPRGRIGRFRMPA